MPQVPKVLCLPRLSQVDQPPVLPAHEKFERQRYNKYQRNPDINKTYGRAWKRIRDRYVAKHPLCELCLEKGRMTPVEEVHHILSIDRGGTHDEANLMSMCRSFHNKVHLELGDRRVGRD